MLAVSEIIELADGPMLVDDPISHPLQLGVEVKVEGLGLVTERVEETSESEEE